MGLDLGTGVLSITFTIYVTMLTIVLLILALDY
jgi:hypothetical protein